MLFKIVIVALFIVIVATLFQGLWFLFKDRGESTRTVRALSWRIGLSLVLFLLLMLGYWLGWIHPHGIQPGMPG